MSPCSGASTLMAPIDAASDKFCEDVFCHFSKVTTSLLCTAFEEMCAVQLTARCLKAIARTHAYGRS